MNSPANILAVSSSALLLWLRRGFLTLFVVLAVWLGMKLILSVLAPSSRWEPVQITQVVAVSAETGRDYDFSYNPFAVGEDQIVVADPTPGDDAPETTLNLQLKGLRSGENGVAFIQTPDGQEDNYYIADEIMQGVILRGVFPDYVLIDVNGQTQRLTTDDAKAARSNSKPAQARDLQTLRSADASDLLSQVQLIPAFDRDMNRTGLMVKARSDAIDLSTYGLESGDVITRFAGQSTLSGLPDMVALRRSVSSGRPITVDILRDGQPLSITIGSSS